MMVDLSDFVWINVGIVLNVFDDRVVAPGSFPKFVKYTQILVSLSISLVVFYGGVNPNGLEGALFP